MTETTWSSLEKELIYYLDEGLQLKVLMIRLVVKATNVLFWVPKLLGKWSPEQVLWILDYREQRVQRTQSLRDFVSWRNVVRLW